MEKALLEQFQKLADKIDGIETRMDGMQSELTSVKGIVLGLENNLTARLESLFDGYKLTHEKQWELERKVEQMEKRLERLEMQVV